MASLCTVGFWSIWLVFLSKISIFSSALMNLAFLFLIYLSSVNYLILYALFSGYYWCPEEGDQFVTKTLIIYLYLEKMWQNLWMKFFDFLLYSSPTYIGSVNKFFFMSSFKLSFFIYNNMINGRSLIKE